MKRYFDVVPKFKETQSTGSSSGVNSNDPPLVNEELDQVIAESEANLAYNLPEQHEDFESLEADPGLRKRIADFHPNVQDEVRRSYIQKGPFQPRDHDFPFKLIGGKKRRFVSSWFDEHKWLEYSIAKDAAFCLPCYLFKNEWEVGGDHFVGIGFSAWNKKDRFYLHVGKPNSPHYNAVKRLEDLMNQKQSIGACFVKQSEQAKSDYLIRLKASLECTRFLLCGGLPFRGHDESIESSYKGHFLETLDLLRQHDSEIDRVLKNAPQNNQMTSPKIQKDLCYACAFLTVHEIIKQMR
ncbi:unnamed protein product [Cuscuta europaea]|uniref:TTF-type domain-containing protein n=1 Tax=Cuscuta europaea TaxID=41803 RepID=A0A9P0YRP4_CUSEU|nr:unnamed protein product [Cuscuta europaea]